MIYGTAWKKEKTKELVELAIKKGFRAIDTACQPKHYREDLVGKGIAQALKENNLSREDLFIQTKFTPPSGQDIETIPYNIEDEIEVQVEASLNKSLENLQVEYIDSLLLHSPISPYIDMKKAWKVLEKFVLEGKIKHLGISNIYDSKLLEYFYNDEDITFKPVIIQNRFYKQTNYDRDIRAFCENHEMMYQSFWSLTANINHLTSGYFMSLSKKYERTPEQIFYRFLDQIGITPLNGTTSEIHMENDLSINDFAIDLEDIVFIESQLYT